MGRAEAAARLGAVTRLLGGGADLPLTPARGGQRLPADTTREVSCRLFLTVTAAGRTVRGPRCLPLLTRLQPLKWFPQDPRKGRVWKGSESESHTRATEEDHTDSGLPGSRAFDLPGPCASQSGLGDGRKTWGKREYMVRLPLTPVNLLALESANLPCCPQLPPAGTSA